MNETVLFTCFIFYFETAVFLSLKRDNGEHDRELQNTHNQGRAHLNT
jgi:hypothetical protein